MRCLYLVVLLLTACNTAPSASSIPATANDPCRLNSTPSTPPADSRASIN